MVQAQHLRPVQANERITPYNFPDITEKEIVYCLCTSPKFWNTVGSHIEPQAFTLDASKALASIVWTHAKKNGPGALNAAFVLGKLHQQVDRGRLSKDTYISAVDLFEAIDDRKDRPNPDSMIDLVGPIIRRRKTSSLISNLVREFAGHQDIGRLISELQRAQRIGETDVGGGTILGPDVFTVIDRLQHIDRMPLGIQDLDYRIDGGIGRSQLCVFAAATGHGKSQALVNVAASALCKGMNVVCASLELEEEVWIARLLANLTGIPTSNILKGDWKKAKEELERLQLHENFGTFKCKWFSPDGTTFDDVRTWAEHTREEIGAIDVLITDYADKLTSSKSYDDSYRVMQHVYEAHRLLAVEWGIFVFTASQKKNSSTSQDADAMADSTHKGRVSDVVIMLTADDTGDHVTYRVAKNRHGAALFSTDPLPTAWEVARISALDVHTKALTKKPQK